MQEQMKGGDDWLTAVAPFMPTAGVMAVKFVNTYEMFLEIPNLPDNVREQIKKHICVFKFKLATAVTDEKPSIALAETVANSIEDGRRFAHFALASSSLASSTKIMEAKHG